MKDNKWLIIGGVAVVAVLFLASKSMAKTTTSSASTMGGVSFNPSALNLLNQTQTITDPTNNPLNPMWLTLPSGALVNLQDLAHTGASVPYNTPLWEQ